MSIITSIAGVTCRKETLPDVTISCYNKQYETTVGAAGTTVIT
jgi:hypothetical protein